MKLTKEDFDLHKCNEKESYMFICKQNPLSVVQQILENQKLRELLEMKLNIIGLDTLMNQKQATENDAIAGFIRAVLVECEK